MVSSNGTTLNTTATSFTLYNITTQQEHDNAFISVRCMDQVGTMGPEAIYRPVVSMLSYTDSITWFDSLLLLQVLNLLLFLILNMLGLVVTCLCMKSVLICR